MRRRRSGWSTCFRPAPRATSSSSTGSRSSPSTTASSHRPSFGAWTLYGLGSEAEDLPGFVVLTSAKGTSGGASNYGSGFLPKSYGGIHEIEYGFHRALAKRFPFCVYYMLSQGVVVVVAIIDARRDPLWIRQRLD